MIYVAKVVSLSSMLCPKWHKYLMKLMFSSRTARGLFTDSKNNSHELFMFRSHGGIKPRLKPRGNTGGTSRVPHFQSSLLNLWFNIVCVDPLVR